MRLTLRTLLSYRDGVLPTKAHEELGQKLRDSQTALDLSNRIDRSLTKPKPLAIELAEIEQTAAPNEVAEFLDGTMSLDRVFTMERKCIASNPMLAELASVHSILARELLGTSKNPSSQPSQAFLARLHALHDPKDSQAENRTAISSPANSNSATKSTSTANQRGHLDIPGVDLESAVSDDNLSMTDLETVQPNRLALQTILLLAVFAALAWWILQETSVLPSIQFPVLNSSKGSSSVP